jgi:hypothetical protein
MGRITGKYYNILRFTGEKEASYEKPFFLSGNRRWYRNTGRVEYA